ncbi:MAG TPA: imidazoleglycerol-phosphate dehydratase [Longimicrobiales bacterium]|nr:imidazoleglycerol-phosphate dehydratase [Longimicrobiales bacterium]
MSVVTRRTAETDITVDLSFSDGAPDLTADTAPVADTGDRFLDHMLVTLGRYAGARLSVEATGDLRHHLVEDVGITLGVALARALPDACRRYADVVVPMDDALVQAALDAGGRPYYEGRLPSRLYEHFLRSLAHAGGVTLHVRVLRGRDRHHVVEAAIKAVGLCVREASRATGVVFSTKGSIDLSVSD